MPRYALKIEYDGQPFNGWQRQDGQPTVQGCIEGAVRKLEPANDGIAAAGRTDTGVHGLAQVAHVDMAKPWTPFRLNEALNAHLRPNPVSILEVAEVADDWHARFSARERRYLFRLQYRRAPVTHDKGLVWQINYPLDVAAMREGAQHLIGNHDFTTFRSSMCQAQSPVKTLDTLEIDETPIPYGMHGFDPKWRDPEDYILGITKAIWEDRKIGSLTRYYGENLIVRSPASIVQGNAGIIAATMATLAEFPDRELFGEDVIWADASEAPGAFLSSHRLICTATHTHPGAYGAPTGRRLSYRILADCYCADNAVHDEWLVRDQSAIVAQMGADIVDWTRDLIAREGGPEACVKPFTPAGDIAGPYRGAGNDHQHGADLAGLLSRIMDADFAAIPAQYDRACTLHYPGNQTWGSPMPSLALGGCAASTR